MERKPLQHATERATIELGKIFLFTRGARRPEASSFAFIDQQPETGAFRDVYGVYRYAAAAAPVSRFGFSERCPVRLRSRAEIGAWFHGGFRDYPHLAEAPPCYFTRTSS